jgi:hypothetical protein
MVRYFLISSIIMVITISSIATIFAFTNHSLVLYSLEKSYNRHYNAITNAISFNSSDTSSITQPSPFFDTCKKDSLSLEAVRFLNLSNQMNNFKATAFSNNTLTFLFTVFSLLFISIGLYLHSNTLEKLHAINNQLTVNQWISASTAFSNYLLSLQNLVVNIPSTSTAAANIIADSRLLSGLIDECFQDMNSNKIGISNEQISFCLQVIDKIHSHYQDIIELSGNFFDSENSISKIKDFQKYLTTLSTKLSRDHYVKRWNIAIKNSNNF